MKCNSSPFLEEKNLIQMGLWTVRFMGEDHTGLCSLPGEVLFFLRMCFFGLRIPGNWFVRVLCLRWPAGWLDE